MILFKLSDKIFFLKKFKMKLKLSHFVIEIFSIKIEIISV